MQPVIQEEPTGCGIAAVATLAGISYVAAKSAASTLGIHAENRSLWSETSHVRRLLRQFDIQAAAAEIPFTSWEALPDLALLATRWHLAQGIPNWHWAVFCRAAGQACVLDSKAALKQHRRRDFGRIKVKWFIPIEPSEPGAGLT